MSELPKLGLMVLTLATVGVFMGKPLWDKETVIDSVDMNVDSVEEVTEMFKCFCADYGYSEEKTGLVYDPRLKMYKGDVISGGLILKTEPNQLTVVRVVVTPVLPEPTQEELDIKAIEEAEDLATTKMFRVWRRRLDTFREAMAALPDEASRTNADRVKAIQLKATIDIVSAFLTDLQRVRPVNESALSI